MTERVRRRLMDSVQPLPTQFRGRLCNHRRRCDLCCGKICRHDDLHKFHIVRPVIETVDDARSLVNAVASLDQCIDTVIVELGPAADHVDDMDVGSVKMKTGAAFGFGGLARSAYQLHLDLTVCGRAHPRVPINKERAQTALGVAGFRGVGFLMTKCRMGHVLSASWSAASPP